MTETSECLPTEFDWSEAWMWTEVDVVLVEGTGGENVTGCHEDGHVWMGFWISVVDPVGGTS